MKSSLFHGLLVLDKPPGLTSRDAVDRALGWFPPGTRAGHTGTLDPLATGVLVLCIGSATRLTEYVQEMPKVYRTTLRLGARSDTDDADGTITPVDDTVSPSKETVERTLQEFVGTLEQVPPAFSAAKVTGRRAYDLARRGAEVSLRARQVHVYGIQMLAYNYPHLELEIHCGKGTYIRSLARDLGERLGCGAYVEVLRRTSVGPFRDTGALSLDADAATARARLLPIAAALAGLPRYTADEREAARLRQGQAIPCRNQPVPASESEEVAIFDAAGNLVAIAGVDLGRRLLRPAKVFSLSGNP
jgi:tRNA pseudouridine55 synthase